MSELVKLTLFQTMSKSLLVTRQQAKPRTHTKQAKAIHRSVHLCGTWPWIDSWYVSSAWKNVRWRHRQIKTTSTSVLQKYNKRKKRRRRKAIVKKKKEEHNADWPANEKNVDRSFSTKTNKPQSKQRKRERERERERFRSPGFFLRSIYVCLPGSKIR